MATVVFLTTTGTNSWTVPADFTVLNTIEVIGGGDGGGGGVGNGGAGGGYSKIVGLVLTPSASITYAVGIGGAPGGAGGDTWFDGASLAASSVGARNDSADGVGTTKYSGGAGGAGGGGNGGGGGGAAGVAGAGGAGATGGGGAGGGTADNGTVAAGANGTEWDATHGSGGGGNGQSGTGDNGARYGGGAGGGGATGGTGYQGLIVITYTPASAVTVIDTITIEDSIPYMEEMTVSDFISAGGGWRNQPKLSQ